MFLQAFNETADNMDYGAAVLIAPRVAVTVATLIRGYVDAIKHTFREKETQNSDIAKIHFWKVFFIEF